MKMAADKAQDVKTEHLLRRCFVQELQNIAYAEVAHKLVDDKYRDAIAKGESIREYLDIDAFKRRVAVDCFYRNYTLENISHPAIKEYLIKELSEFEHYTEVFEKNGGPFPEYVTKYKGRPYGANNKRNYENFCYMLSNALLYQNGYDESRNMLTEKGFTIPSGGTRADYVRSGIIVFKDTAVAARGYLLSLKQCDCMMQLESCNGKDCTNKISIP